MSNCITGGIEAYNPSPLKPWNRNRVRHLYSRACNGASYEDIEAGLSMSPGDLVDMIVEDAMAIPVMETPEWSMTMEASGYFRLDVISDWITKGLAEGLRAKIMIFWSNHFVTQTSILGLSGRSFWPYFDILWRHSLGHLPTLTKDLAKSYPMLRYLDGYINKGYDPNENYARELLELFTLGEGNGYTENDISEAAKALAGWRINYGSLDIIPTASYLYEPWVNTSDKTIFGITDNFDFDGVHDLIFQERPTEVARHICRKLYMQFIYEFPDDAFVNDLAEIFKLDWDIAQVLKHMFKSEHFMSNEAFGALIKDPVDSTISIFRNMGLKKAIDDSGAVHFSPSADYYIGIYPLYAGQLLFDPPNVAGWPRHRSWMSQTNFVNRKYYGQLIVNNIYAVGWNAFLASIVAITNNSADPLFITEKLLKHFIQVDLDLERINQAEIIFRGDVPSNYYEDGTWDLAYPGVTTQLKDFIKWIVQQPEWELQ